MKTSSLLPLAIVALLTAGCDGIFDAGRDDVELSVASNRYVAGERVTIHLVNHTDETIGYNLCMLELDRREQDGWVPVTDRVDTPCLAILYTLAPGGSYSVHVMLPDDFPAAEYRGRTSVTIGEEPTQVLTRSFLVQEAAVTN